MSTSTDSRRLDDNRFDSTPDQSTQAPFLFPSNWSAQELTDAVRWSPPPLHRFDFAPSANDAATHRPRRGGSFLALAPLPPRFRIGG